jgi:hypothetical protein
LSWRSRERSAKGKNSSFVQNIQRTICKRRKKIQCTKHPEKDL